MRTNRLVGAAALAAAAGLAIAGGPTAPVIDGIYDEATEAAFYGDIIWVNNQPTSFGDNSAGLFTGGEFGDPENVTTGVEVCVPKAALGNPNTLALTGWINSGDRSFMSNQIIGSLPIDTANIGNPTVDFTDATRFPGNQFVSVSSIPVATPTVDGTLDAAYTARAFLQGNFTGFGDNNQATEIGAGGSEIDAVYVTQDDNNFYFFFAGNVEANGNGLDVFIDTDGGASGAAGLGSGSGSGGFIIDGQSTLVFDAGFRANYVLSVDSVDDNGDRLPRAFLGSNSSGDNFDVDLLGTLAGYGAANAGVPTGGDSGVPSVQVAIDNSNIVGVIGSPSESSPVSPDANWAYGSELDNVRANVVGDKLYIFVGGNMQTNFNKLSFFFDTKPGGQNELRNDNVDISFGGLNRMGGDPNDDPNEDTGVRFDSGFEADYWFNVNNGVDGGTGNLINFADAALLPTNGKLRNLFDEVVGYGCFFGGGVTDAQGNLLPDNRDLINFSGPRLDGQDGTVENLFAEFAPQQATTALENSPNPLMPTAPTDVVLEIALDNSNVAGVTDSSASAAAAAAVNTGIEICVDLDELGWDGSQDILMAGWISSGSFDFVSNQVFGGLPAADQLGEVKDIDFSTITGDQFINLFGPAVSFGCNAADLAEPFGVLNIDDVLSFLNAFAAGDPAADLVPPATLNIDDVLAFLNTFAGGCP